MFDVWHPGYITLLDDLASHCDFIIAGLQTTRQNDRPMKSGPAFGIVERQMMLLANENVDDVIVYERDGEIEQILRWVQPEVRILGSDYNLSPADPVDLPDFENIIGGEELHEELDIAIVFHDRGRIWSATDARKRIKVLTIQEDIDGQE